MALRFEEALTELQSIVRKLEGGELPLEEGLKQFEDGIKLIRSCQSYLTQVEQKVRILTSSSESQTQSEPFHAQENST